MSQQAQKPPKFDIENFLAEFRAKKYPPKRYKRNLSPEFIEAARQRALRVRPWEKSTGPKTPEGKAKVGQNNFRHGRRSRVMQEVNKLITEITRN